MKKLIVLLFLVSATIPFISCTNTKSAYEKENVIPTTEQSNKKIINYNNGVYYFNSTRAEFANTLSFFLKENQDLELVSMTSDDYSGGTLGYFVVFKKREVSEKK